jgi:FkbM family methyltransferase
MVTTMWRQIKNLWHSGRLRSLSTTRRRGKPKFLQQNPDLEITNALALVVAELDIPHDEFFFIQIGAFDGVTGDPIYELVRRHNWHGVLVEPQSSVFERLQSNYAGQPGLQFFNVAIGPQDGELTLFSRPNGDVCASVAKHRVQKPGERKSDVQVARVPCWTLRTLLERAQAPRSIDLLQIDAEGWDYEIIRSIEFSAVRPRIIRYEHQVLSERDRNACLALLAECGYRFLLEDADTTAVLPASVEAGGAIRAA